MNADLVLEGGGVKGIGLVGAALTLHEAGHRFPRVAGTSAGAIVASLIAGLSTRGRDMSELADIMRSLDYDKFKDGSWLTRYTGAFGEIEQLLVHDGMYRGDYLREWLGNQLSDLGVHTFADLRIPLDDDPGTGLPPDRRYRLVVHASDITRKRLVRFPWDYAQYGLEADDQLVVDAVRASMSIPFFFRPVELTCGDGGGTVTLVDGGLLSNYPIEVFDRHDGVASRWPTWGIKLSADWKGEPQITHATNHAFGVLLGCAETLLSDWDHYHLDDDDVAARTVFVDTFGTSAVDFELPPATVERLYQSGRAAAEKFLLAHPALAPAGSAATPAPAPRASAEDLPEAARAAAEGEEPGQA